MLKTQKISALIRMRSRPTSKKGSIVMQLTIDGEVKPYSLGISWPKALFDPKTERLLPRETDDELCRQHNLYLKSEQGKWNQLILKYYVSERVVGHRDFQKALKLSTAKGDIIDYFRIQASILGAENEVSEPTVTKYFTCFNRMDRFFENEKRWKFNSINFSDLRKLEIWMMESLSWNTLCGHMRVLHKFFGLAAKDGMIVNNPMDEYKMKSFQEGVREPLEIHEIRKLKDFYHSATMTDFERDVLKRYLISCYTGLRKSDIEQLDPRFHIRNGNVLRLSMFKTRNYGKTVEFKMSRTATELIGKKRGQLFPFIESGLICRTLRALVYRAGIDKYIKFHSGRDSFSIAYLEFGGNIKDLQDILGHGSIKSTVIYLKMSSRTKSNTISKFDTI